MPTWPATPFLQVEAAQCQAIPPLVKILEESSYVGKESAAGALGNLACNEENKASAAEGEEEGKGGREKPICCSSAPLSSKCTRLLSSCVF